ncbi:MAG: DUF1003 domain-containing protein [Acidobacteria bacterium]|nr:DUF1003 domain-containing protein [Acidobacteriota bacterium]
MAQQRIEARVVPARPRSKVTEIEERVRKALADRRTVTRDIETEYEEKLSLGNRVADVVAAFGGSWTFIFTFGAIMAAWMLINSQVLKDGAFDPFPYILLNLILSTLAALQAPVIMMSQNRQNEKDRVRAEHDYEINLKAEIEIGQIHKKLDEFRDAQWVQLVAMQHRQIEYLEKLVEVGRGGERAT